MREPGRPLAQISTLKPGGTFSLSSAISVAGVCTSLPACGASATFSPRFCMPCFHMGVPSGTSGFAAAETSTFAGADAAGAAVFDDISAQPARDRPNATSSRCLVMCGSPRVVFCFSIRLDAGRLDHRPPLVHFRLVEGAQRFGRLLVRRRNLLAQVLQPLAHGGI